MRSQPVLYVSVTVFPSRVLRKKSADRPALVLYYKRLERGVFHFPTSDEAALTIDSTQLLQLLAGGEVVTRRAG